MAVQKAYERLQLGGQGGQGPQPWRLLLLLKVFPSQCCSSSHLSIMLQTLPGWCNSGAEVFPSEFSEARMFST